MYPKVGLVEETKRGGKDEEVVNNKIHHIYVGTRHRKTH
jgi:hypothetical protein